MPIVLLLTPRRHCIPTALNPVGHMYCSVPEIPLKRGNILVVANSLEAGNVGDSTQKSFFMDQLM